MNDEGASRREHIDRRHADPVVKPAELSYASSESRARRRFEGIGTAGCLATLLGLIAAPLLLYGLIGLLRSIDGLRRGDGLYALFALGIIAFAVLFAIPSGWWWYGYLRHGRKP